MALREILVSFGFEFDKAQEEAILSAVDKMKKAAIALGIAFSAKQIVDFINDTVHAVAELGDEIGETAQKLGINAQALQELGAIAKDSGASMQDMGTSMRFISKNAVAANEGNKEMQESFAKLGVSVTDSNGKLKTADQIFVELADGFVGVEDPAERTALAMQVLGRSGTQLLPTLLKGTEALQEQRAELARTGAIMDDELLDLSDQYSSAMHEQELATQGLKNAFAKELLPAFIKGAKATAELIIRIRPLAQWLGSALTRAGQFATRIMRGLFDAFSTIADGVFKLGPLLGTLVVALTGLAFWFAFAGQAGVIAALKTAAAWVIANAPLIFMVLLLAIIVAAIVLVIEDLEAMGEGAESVIGTLTTGISDLIDQMGGVGPAIFEMIQTAFDFWAERIFGIKNAFEELFGDREKYAGQVDVKKEDLVPVDYEETKKDMSFWEKAARSGGEFLFGAPVQSYVPAAGGGTSQGDTNVDIKIDASGSNASAEEIAVHSERHIEAVLERRDRELMNASVAAAPGG